MSTPFVAPMPLPMGVPTPLRLTTLRHPGESDRGCPINVAPSSLIPFNDDPPAPHTPSPRAASTMPSRSGRMSMPVAPTSSQGHSAWTLCKRGPSLLPSSPCPQLCRIDASPVESPARPRVATLSSRAVHAGFLCHPPHIVYFPLRITQTTNIWQCGQSCTKAFRVRRGGAVQAQPSRRRRVSPQLHAQPTQDGLRTCPSLFPSSQIHLCRGVRPSPATLVPRHVC